MRMGRKPVGGRWKNGGYRTLSQTNWKLPPRCGDRLSSLKILAIAVRCSGRARAAPAARPERGARSLRARGFSAVRSPATAPQSGGAVEERLLNGVSSTAVAHYAGKVVVRARSQLDTQAPDARSELPPAAGRGRFQALGLRAAGRHSRPHCGRGASRGPRGGGGGGSRARASPRAPSSRREQ